MKIRILLVQLEAIIGDIQANINKIKTLISENKQKEFDLVVLPELWTVGWDSSSFINSAQELYTSDTFQFLQLLAKKYNTNIIGGSAILYKNKEKPRNTSLIFDRTGNLKAVYDKYHLFSHRGESEGKFLQEGENGLIVNLDIGKIGVSTCYDIRFPELFRLYAFNGADFVVNMAAWPLGFYQEYETLLHSRAIENQMYYISSCLTGKINDNYEFSGNSQICDYRGRIVNKLDREEKALYTEISINEMLEYRKQMPILNDRKNEYKIMER